MSATTTALLIAIVTAAFAVESAIGFGATVITVSLGALVASIPTVLPSYIPVNMALSGYLVLRYRKDIAWRVLAARIAPFVAVGMPVGFWAGTAVPERVGVRLFGAFVITLAVTEAIARLRAHRAAETADVAEHPAKTWARDVFAMTGCGVLFGMYGTGGPLGDPALPEGCIAAQRAASEIRLYLEGAARNGEGPTANPWIPGAVSGWIGPT